MIELPGSLQEQLQSCRTLPSVPTVVIKVLNLCEMEEVGISEIARVLSRDPALSAKVLRIANSAFYGVRSQVTTVDRAISIMGINATLSLALSFSFVGNLGKSRKAGFDHIAYWRRSGITAAAGKSLSQWTKKMSRDELFLACLLQDIGMLVLNEAIPETYGSIIASAGLQHERLVELENEALNADHGTVGAWMMERWKLPENLTLCVAASHNPRLLAEAGEEDYILVSALAGQIAEIWCNPDTTVATMRARDAASNLLGMTDEKFEWLLADIANSLPGITENLDINIGGEEQVNRLLDQAREALVILNLQSQRAVHQMQNLVETDALTALSNRGYLESVLPKHFEDARLSNRPLSVIFADIDHFKDVNDEYGHQTGDAILVMVARELKLAMRSTDVATRYGGEEFVCLLPDTSEEAVRLVAERLRKAIEISPHGKENARAVFVTVSFGCATFSPERNFDSPGEFLEEADRCLYKAKQLGRNRVVSAKSLSDGGNKWTGPNRLTENATFVSDQRL